MTQRPHLRLNAAMTRFGRETRGSMTLEVLLVVPLLVWALLFTISTYDAFRAQDATTKAANAIADMISRQVDTLAQDDIDTMQGILEYISAAKPANNARLRITALRATANDSYDVEWSHASNGLGVLNNVDLIADQLPTLPQGDRLIAVETRFFYQPPFVIGLSSNTLSQLIAVQPRYVARLAFDLG